MKVRNVLVLVCLSAVAVACSDSINAPVAELEASYAHNSNNQAGLSGMQGANGITGNGIIVASGAFARRGGNREK